MTASPLFTAAPGRAIFDPRRHGLVVGATPPPPAFSPDQITGLRLWLDAQDSSTLSGPLPSVSQWDDKSGNGRNFQQVSAPSQQPAIVTRNLVQWLRFENSNMTGPDGLGFVGNPAVTSFCVVGFNSLGSPAGGVLGFGRGSSGSQDNVINYSFDSADRSYRHYGGFQGFSPPTIGVDEIQTWQRAAGDTYDQQRLFIGGVELTPAGAGNGSKTPTLNDGQSNVGGHLEGDGKTADRPMDGWIGEILVYDTVLSIADHNAVGQYLSDKWGVSWNDL